MENRHGQHVGVFAYMAVPSLSFTTATKHFTLKHVAHIKTA